MADKKKATKATKAVKAKESDPVAFAKPAAEVKAESDLVRTLRWQLEQANRATKQVNKVMGKQGETIHLLRAEVAEARELNYKIERGDLRRLERLVPELRATIDTLTSENEKLLEKLEDQDDQEVGV